MAKSQARMELLSNKIELFPEAAGLQTALLYFLCDLFYLVSF